MTKETQLSTTQQLIKHSLLWTVFGYCYHSAVSLLVKMAADAQPMHMVLAGFIYCAAFNILVAHLITKYDKRWPIVASLYIGIVGLLVVPLLLLGSGGLLDFILLGGILFSLVLSCYLVSLLKAKLSKN